MNSLAKEDSHLLSFDLTSPEHLETFKARYPEARFWLLINPLKEVSSLSPVYPAKLAELCAEDMPEVVPVDDLAWMPQACPQLWSLAQPTAQFFRQVIDYARTEATQDVRAVCALIASEQPAGQLAQGLVQTSRELGQQCAKTTLSFYEPLRCELLDEQLRAYLPENCHWWYITTQGDTAYIHLDQVALQKPALTWGMRCEQQEIRNISRLLRLWQAASGPHQPLVARQAATAWLNAQESGLMHDADRFWLALTSLTQPEVLAHPQFKTLLADVVKNPNQRLIDIVETLPADLTVAP